MQLKAYLPAIPDHRRAQGRMYDLTHLLLFSILAVVSGATSYRKIQRFMDAHRERLNALCQLHWKRAPVHTSIRYALQGLDAKAGELAFHRHASGLDGEGAQHASIAMDGKTLRAAVSITSRTARPLRYSAHWPLRAPLCSATCGSPMRRARSITRFRPPNS
ncbi:ISMca6, transposase, OrfA [Nitrococcus mobilis Nb-231]|uniref:ISMca6, transposase, OrfA n=2 Tax=Nitrococcus mobilis TaxID=35797 RepID=A4BTE5_9GAMM|nr:ISMca6, transposase, OrfA [Nitrococcus mobilis Nb-231]